MIVSASDRIVPATKWDEEPRYIAKGDMAWVLAEPEVWAGRYLKLVYLKLVDGVWWWVSP